MINEQLPQDFRPVVKGKKQVTTGKVVDFLKGKTVVLDCG